jgi:transcriptional regulator with XRE-family HTH domain
VIAMTTWTTSRSSVRAADPLLRPPLHLDDFRCIALGQVIAEHRYQKEINRDVFAEIIGVRLDQLDRIEAGHVEDLPISLYWAIADVLGVDLAELLHETRWRMQELAAHRWTIEATARRMAS